mmetsp:Transcript_16633/g.25126  ORF Transcript_16633/g.25126 Transcript_16633/m.25126 type:complete len:102 (+) Transcript_16633:1531-1836(+)
MAKEAHFIPTTTESIRSSTGSDWSLSKRFFKLPNTIISIYRLQKEKEHNKFATAVYGVQVSVLTDYNEVIVPVGLRKIFMQEVLQMRGGCVGIFRQEAIVV